MKLPFSLPSVIMATVLPARSSALTAAAESLDTLSMMTSAFSTPSNWVAKAAR